MSAQKSTTLKVTGYRVRVHDDRAPALCDMLATDILYGASPIRDKRNRISMVRSIRAAGKRCTVEEILSNGLCRVVPE